MTLLFGHCEEKWPKPKQQKHLMSWLREVGVSLFLLPMVDMSFFSLRYSSLPSLFIYNRAASVLAFQLGFQGFEGSNCWLCQTVPFHLNCLSIFTTICIISPNSIIWAISRLRQIMNLVIIAFLSSSTLAHIIASFISLKYSSILFVLIST